MKVNWSFILHGVASLVIAGVISWAAYTVWQVDKKADANAKDMAVISAKLEQLQHSIDDLNVRFAKFQLIFAAHTGKVPTIFPPTKP